MKEKLIEEISLYVTRNVLHEWAGSERDCPMYFGRLDFEAKDVEWLITRIAQTIIETGELDETLGIVGRRKIRHIDHEYIDDQRLKKGDILIAVRPEEEKCSK